MLSYPFTNEGVLAWQLDFHQLTAEVQQEEINSMRLDFFSWMSVRFMIHRKEMAFITGLSDRLLREVQRDLVAALRQGMLIELIMEAPPPTRRLNDLAGVDGDGHDGDGEGPEDSIKVMELKKKVEEGTGNPDPEPDPDPVTSNRSGMTEMASLLYDSWPDIRNGHVVLRSYYVPKPH